MPPKKQKKVTQKSLDKQLLELFGSDFGNDRLRKSNASLQEVNDLLEQGANPNADKNGTTALMYAVWKNEHKDTHKIVQALINRGADVCRVSNSRNDTLAFLMQFRKSNDTLPILKTLLGAKEHSAESLEVALGKKLESHQKKSPDLKKMRVLLNGHLAEARRGSTAESSSQQESESESESEEISQEGSSEEEQWTQKELNENLIQAIRNSSLEEIERWLELGASVNAKEADETTALMLAAQNNSMQGYQMVETLLLCNANVNAIDQDGNNALMLCARNNISKDGAKIVQALLDGGSDVLEHNGNQTALTYAKKNKVEKHKKNAIVKTITQCIQERSNLDGLIENSIYGATLHFANKDDLSSLAGFSSANLFDRFKDLKKIVVRGCSNLQYEGLERMLGGCSHKLGELDISNCLNLEGLDYLFDRNKSKFRNLHTLDLSGHEELTDENLSVILKSCPNLTTLNLSGCDKLTNDALPHIAKLKDLGECVVVVGVTRINNKYIETARKHTGVVMQQINLESLHQSYPNNPSRDAVIQDSQPRTFRGKGKKALKIMAIEDMLQRELTSTVQAVEKHYSKNPDGNDCQGRVAMLKHLLSPSDQNPKFPARPSQGSYHNAIDFDRRDDPSMDTLTLIGKSFEDKAETGGVVDYSIPCLVTEKDGTQHYSSTRSDKDIGHIEDVYKMPEEGQFERLKKTIESQPWWEEGVKKAIIEIGLWSNSPKGKQEGHSASMYIRDGKYYFIDPSFGDDAQDMIFKDFDAYLKRENEHAQYFSGQDWHAIAFKPLFLEKTQEVSQGLYEDQLALDAKEMLRPFRENLRNKNNASYAYTDQDIDIVNQARNTRDGFVYLDATYNRQEANTLGIGIDDDQASTIVVTSNIFSNREGKTIIELPAISTAEVSPIGSSLETQLSHLGKVDIEDKYPVTIIAPYKLSDSWHWNVLEITIEDENHDSIECRRYNTDGRSYPVEDSIFAQIKEVLPTIENDKYELGGYPSIQLGVNCGLGAARIMHDLKTGGNDYDGALDLDRNLTKSDADLRKEDNALVQNNNPNNVTRFCSHDLSSQAQETRGEHSIRGQTMEAENAINTFLVEVTNSQNNLNFNETKSLVSALSMSLESEMSRVQFQNFTNSVSKESKQHNLKKREGDEGELPIDSPTNSCKKPRIASSHKSNGNSRT